MLTHQLTNDKVSQANRFYVISTSDAKIPKYEQLKFTINVNNKKWLLHYRRTFLSILEKKIGCCHFFRPQGSGS